MMTTLVSVARSLETTRASVFIAGAWTLSFRIQKRQKIGAALVVGLYRTKAMASTGNTASRPISH